MSADEFMHDVFLAYSHADSIRVQQLAGHLAHAGMTAFIASSGKYLQPGDRWPECILKAQLASRMTLAFVSKHTEKSHYQKEEIASAIWMACKNPASHRVVPVFMDVIPDPPPYGLRILQGILWDTTQDPEGISLVQQVQESLLVMRQETIGSGIAPRDAVFGKDRLPGQVFAAELLTQPLHVKREGGRIRLIVDRRGVREGVYTNAGKTRLCKNVLRDEGRRVAEQAEVVLHDLLRGKDRRPSYPLYLDKFPLRWASGGALSVVEIRETGKVYTPFFFRDIPPIGWHISLGASENEEELAQPVKYSCREFFEETLVIRGVPEIGGSRRKRFGGGIGDLWLPALAEVEAFATEHILLRNAYDGLAIVDDAELIDWTPDPTTMNLRVIDPSGKEKNYDSCFLLSVNVMELGIETVMLLKYQLSQDDYLLDGEMLTGEVEGQPLKTTLVRMPMALISHDYLNEVFGNRESMLSYEKATLVDIDGNVTEVEQPSVKPARPPTESEIRIFHWDACRRRALAVAPEGAPDYPRPRERKRHEDWVRNFARYFFDDHGQPTGKNAYPLFTPPSAKAMTYYFANKAAELTARKLAEAHRCRSPEIN